MNISENFLSLPNQIYSQDELKLKPTPESVMSQLSTIAEKPDVHFQIFENAEARLVGFFHKEYELNDAPCAYFGFWEGLNNTQAHQALFDEMQTWAKSKGAQSIIGPIDFSTYFSNRIRIDHFDRPSFLGEPTNPEYYPDILKECGFEIEMTYGSWFQTLKTVQARSSAIGEPALEKLSAMGFTVAPMTAEIWQDNLKQFYTLIHETFKANFAYMQVSYEEFVSAYGESFSKKFCSKCSCFIRDPAGEIIAFFAVYPDYTSVVIDKGISSSEVNYNDHFDMIDHKVLMGKTVGVAPKYGNMHLFPIMSHYATKAGVGLYDEAAAILIREDNTSARAAQMTFGDENKRSYALFSKKLG